jgi:AcrR family transcriptional regulator
MDAIRRAALELFSERGYDAVSVTDIAERAEVGRTTFFRYFGDKQEVLFTEPAEHGEQAAAGAVGLDEPIGSSMAAAIATVRQLVVSYVRHLTADPYAYGQHQRLVSGQPELYARSLVKHRSYVERMTSQLESWGADFPVARQAAEIGMACYYAGQATADDDPSTLAQHVSTAFDRITSSPD